MLEAAQVPPENIMAAFVQKGMESLAVSAIKTLRIFRIYGRQKGDEFPAWSREVFLEKQIYSEPVIQTTELSTSVRKEEASKNGINTSTLVSKSNSLVDAFHNLRKSDLFEKASTLFEKSSKTQKILFGFGTFLGFGFLFIGFGIIFGNREISSELLLKDDGYEYWSEGTWCTGTGRYGDIGGDTQIVVKNDVGKTIAIGSLQSGSIANGSCLFPIEIEDIPDSGFYVIEIGSGRRGSLSYSRKEMQSMNWELGISIGD